MPSFTDDNGIFWGDPDELGYGPGSDLSLNKAGRVKLPPVQRVIDSFGGVPCQFVRPDDSPIRPGEICGLIHDRCIHHMRSRTEKPERIAKRGNPCGVAARHGGIVCRLHAPSKNAKDAAARRYAAELAAAQVGKLAASKGIPVDDPVTALTELAGEQREWNRATQALVEALESPLVGVGDSVELHPLVVLAERSHTRFSKTLHDMVKLGLQEQRLHLEESKLAVVERALVAVFVKYGLDPELGRLELASQLLTMDALDATGRELEGGAS